MVLFRKSVRKSDDVHLPMDPEGRRRRRPSFLHNSDAGAMSTEAATADAEAVDHEQIASLALSTYLGLPPRGAKPGVKSNGRLEWTVLAAFALSFPSTDGSKPREYTLISLATGLRCLPYASLTVHGDVLHDQHAEVLARRAARLWLLHRLEQEHTSPGSGVNSLFEPEHSDALDGAKRWRLRSGVQCHLYVSTLPCGAASSRLLEFQRAAQDAAAQKPGAPTPDKLLNRYLCGSTDGLTTSSSRSGAADVVRGRASSTQQPGTSASLRTKPGRPDAPPSICMSCSDKLALWNAPGVGIQGALLSALIAPVHISSVTIADHPLRYIFPPSYPDAEARVDQLKLVLADDCKRALERAMDGRRSIQVGWSEAVYPDSKEAKLQTSSTEAEPESCVNSVVHIADPTGKGKGKKAKTENLAAGTKMGAPTKRAAEQPLKPAARSGVCRLNYFGAVVATMRATGRSVPDGLVYANAKQGCLGGGTMAYRQAKDAVLGPRDAAQQAVDSFLERATRATAINTPAPAPGDALHPSADAPPLHGWLRSPAHLAHFDLSGHRTRQA
ncbi:hypothetical protein PaG_04634 [Moesziomyces aphidis]|uniref:A to I editase domain-containing protein n=1 Tax=Moesziomyces aphidis TaxID=84754 RepID=W3VJ29_MOEAP|nr:hypothetical protein PaG_04634 [Moesziomyces aphidis]